jgi:uncharacterized protein YdeI (YjbR/CyaY-like superfamily)
MAKQPIKFDMFSPKDRHEWRKWLEQNHATSTGIWLVYYKKGVGKPVVSHDDMVEEALCFGWIDSLRNTLDDESYKQLFTPRKRKSVWSKLNKTRIEHLIANGQMTEAGLARIEAAKRDGSWNSLDEVEELTLPPDLEAAYPVALANFTAFAPSSKKIILLWLRNAKKPETRQKRIEETIRLAEKNIKANHR